MKVKQFLNKMLYASSSIKTVEVVRRRGNDREVTVLSDVELRNPMDSQHQHFYELDSTVMSFGINGDVMRVYAQ